MDGILNRGFELAEGVYNKVKDSNDYITGKSYSVNDIISVTDDIYISLVDNNTEVPNQSSKKWRLIYTHHI